MFPFILFFSLFFFIFCPENSKAAYKVYLKNGQIMKGVDEVNKEAGKIKIIKYGIMLELPEASVIKIEEYEISETTEEKTIAEKKTTTEEELPEYSKDKEAPYGSKQEIDKNRELLQLKTQYQLVLDKLKRIETLEIRSKELEGRIYRSLRLLSPRKARLARKEKAEIDRELEVLRMEQVSLLKQKKELELRLLNFRDYERLEEPENIPQKEKYEETQEKVNEELKIIELRRIPGRDLKPDTQLQELKRLESEGKLPEQFKSYKDFLEKQHQREKKHIEGH